MTPSRLVRLFVAILLLTAIPSIAAAATTEFRVLFDVDNDANTGCTVNDMDGVDQVLVTQVTEGDPMRVTRTHRQVCMGVVLGSPVDINTSGWDAGWNPVNKLLTIETRIPFMAFGTPEMPSDVHAGFDGSRNGAVHTAIFNADGSPIMVPHPPARRRAVDVGAARVITMDGNLADWGNIRPIVFGLASNGTNTLRLLRILAWADPNDDHLYFAATAYLGSDHPYADDNFYLRDPGQSLSVNAPGVLDNDGIPGNAPLSAQKVSDPARGTVTLNADGSFTYSPTHPQLLSSDEFEYKATGAGKESNVARVIIQVNQNESPNAPQDDQYTTPEDTPKIVAAPGVLDNDPHGDFLVASLFDAPDHGTVVLNPDGGFTYIPAADFFGVDTFVYTATKKLGAPPGIGGNATVTITVLSVNDAPDVVPATFTIPENSPNDTIVGTVDAFDPDGDLITYSIVAGNTGGAFSINASTGQIRVANSAALDFETNPTFSLTVRVEDASDDDEATITINLTDTNESPVIVAGGTLNYTENDPPAVIDGSLTVTDTDSGLTGATVVISNNFAAGQDVLSFTPVGAITGIFSGNTLTLSGNDTPANYQIALRSVTYQNTSEDPSIAARTITWTATDGTFTSAPVTSTVNVIAVDDAPVFTSSNTPSVPENTTAVLTVVASDLEGQTLTYSISGGADAALFTINSSTGALSFISAPNFEAPADAGTNNVYDVTVQVSDGTNTPTQNIAVTVTDVNEAPVFSSSATPSVPENTTAVGTVVATDPEGGAVTYSISGGADAALFSIDAVTGALSFISAPNFEAPADAGANNVYDIVVTAADGTNNPTQNIAVTVTNVNEAPTFTSSATPSIPENTTAVINVTTIDQEGDTTTYSITGGADAALFTINSSTGALSFISAPNFEAPADAGANNVYDVIVTASDGTNAPTQAIAVTVTDVNEPPVFTSTATPSVPENTTAVVTVTTTDQEGNTITYSITGGADAALFSINGATGALTFNSAPNFEAPADAGANNVYDVIVTASDGTNAPTQNIAVTVTDVNEPPVFTSTATPSVPENQTAVLTVTTTDQEGNTITYSISGGADAALFSINSSTGALSFLSAPNFESPADAGANNVYDIVVTASDGTNAPTQNLTITVTDLNEAPVFTSSASPSVAENTTAVTTVTTTDEEGNAITYSISGGADAALFSIDSGTGVLTFNVAPNFEAPGDAGADNVYDIVVTASDGTNAPTQNIAVTVTDVNEAPLFTSSATPSVPENQTAVLTVTTSDEEGNIITYSISGGADAALFSIDSSTGVLTFNSAPNFDAPADAGANNVYDIVVTADDGINAPTQNIAITVTDLNEAPVFTSSATPSAPENQTAVLTVTTTDQEGNTITYSITGGADSALFSIDSSTGVLTFNSAPDFEAPADAGGNNVYDIVVTANDGTNAPTQNITITVTDVNETPVFTSSATPSVPENQSAVLTVTTSDPEGNTITYSISGGADMALLSIDSGTGALTFNSAPDFEAPADAGGNNVYDIVVTADDGTNAPTQNITITVTDVNEAPVFTSSASPSLAENTTAVTTVTTTDQEGNTITYSISGGADAALFSIDSGTGVLTFNSAPDFEAPADAGGNNVYDIVVTANDGTNAPTQNITITVTDVNETPVFTSSATPSVPENQTAVLTVTTTDPEGNTITYSISGGADMALFSIDSSTGVLTFNSAPNFEAPADAGLNNVYDIVVTADDGTNAPTQNITITVTDVNEAPVFTSSATPSVAENTTAVMTVTTTDAEGNPITYSITGGADMALFSINSSTGVLTFDSAPDFEAPADAGGNNVYDIVVTANDGTNAPTQNITVTVTDVNETPVFTSSATPSVPENQTAVLTVTTSDPEGNTITYSVSGGADMALFSIDSGTGALTFNSAPDFDAPADAGANNVYDVIVTASDGTNAPTQAIAVTVTDVNEAPTFTSSNAPSVAENGTSVLTVTTTDQEGDTITYSISGGADAALFSINSSTGALSFNAPPDFENPTDADSNNIYEVIVTADDGPNAPTQTINVTVTDVNEAPAFTSSATPSVPENTTAVVTVSATDPEGVAITYSITGGADQALFTINSSTGALSFLSAPNFEAPADTGANNVYDVIVTAGDGVNNPTQAIAVTVTDANETPTFTSSATPSIPENTTAVITVTTTDPEGNTITYSISGGADQALFTINSSTGALSFLSAPNFEAPADAGANNVYDVIVTASDGTNAPTQAIAVTVTDVNEAPAFTSSATPSVPENTTAVVTVSATDPEGVAITYSISGGADQALFTINSSTGALSFLSAPNFEAPADAGANNVYDVIVTAGDGVNNPTQAIAVTVTDVNETPTFTSSATPSVPENTTAVITVTTTDPEGDTITYSISGGADQALFTINSSTGALSFLSAPNFEAPADAGANNVYDVIVTASDGTNAPTQAIAVTVTDVNEAPSFTSSATPSVPENTTAVVTVSATDPEGVAPTYSISGGADMALFTINGATGELSFLSAPNFEAPADAGANNVYDVVVTAGDGTNNPTQAIAVTVTNVNESPSFTSSATPSVPENTTAAVTVTTSDPEGNTITYSITGGDDGALFTINSGTGALFFLSAPNFEAPADAGANNVYDVVVTASDGTNNPTQAIAVTVTNVNEPPSITSGNAFSVPENSAGVTTVTSTDPEGNTVTYSLTGGADQGDFAIDTNTGVLTFSPLPNFEAPADSDFNNVYVVQVTATDGTNPVNQTITVTVTNVQEGPVFTSANSANFNENAVGTVLTATAIDDDGDTVTFAITAGADMGDLSIDTNTGAITFNVSPNFEAPTDSDTNNTYVIDVTATSTGGTDVQTITITVLDVNEPPVITSGAPADVPENTVGTIHTVTATDPDGTSPTFAIVGGADAADFNINATTGALTFVATPNFEAPVDANLDNVYEITVRATDGTLFDDESYTITVTNVNEAPVAGADANNYIGNTELRVAGHAGTANALAFTTSATNPMANDSDPDSIASGFGTISIVAAGPTTTPNNGIYRIETDGTFYYTPPAGFIGTDTITYQLTDSTNTVPGTITLTMTGTDVVWYVRNNDPTADAFATNDGTSSDPFNTLALAQTASLVNHIVYVHSGDGTTTGQNAGFVMKNNQKLWGQGVALVVNGATTLITAGSQPLIGNSGGAGVTATNLTGIEIRGLNIAGSTDAVAVSLTVASTVTANISNNTIRAAGNEGIDVDASAGSLSIAVNDNTLTTTGTAIDIAETAAGAITITAFDDNVVSGNSAGTGISVTGATFDTVAGGAYTTVSGGITAIGASGNGVGASGMVLTNVSGDLAFTDLDVFADAGSGVVITGTGAVNTGAGTGTRVTVGVGVGVVQSIGGPAVSVNNATIDFQLSSLTSTNTTTTGVSLTSVSDGTTNALFSAGAGSSITTTAGATGPAFNISGGNTSMTYAGTITNNSASARAVLVDSWAGDDAATDNMVFSGFIDENGAGIRLNANSGSRSITFSGGLDIDTTTGEGFSATSNTNALGLNITGTNDITSTSATALRVTSTTIGASHITFRNVSSGNNTAAAEPVNGIVINSTGATGSLRVQGTGSAGTGGTIQNTTGVGILLTSTEHPAFNYMNIQTSGDDGIRGSVVNNMTLNTCNLTNNGNATAENGLQLGEASGVIVGITGTLTITSTNITGSAGNNVHIRNTSGNLAAMNITGGSFDDLNDVTGANSFLFEMSGTATNTASTINGAGFDNNSPQRALEVQTHGSGTISNFTVQGCTFNNNGIHASFTQDTTSNLTFRMLSNNMQLADPLHAINVFSSSTSTGGSITGTIESNTIGTAGTSSSGAKGNAIRLAIQGRTTGSFKIHANVIRQVWLAGAGARGMDLQFLGPTAGAQPITQSDIMITNNDVDTMAPASAFPGEAMFLSSDNQGSPTRVRAQITGNNARNSVAGGSFGYPTFDGNGAHLVFIEAAAGAEGQLVDTAPASANALAELTSANPATSATRIYESGISLIAGPIVTPP